MTLSFRLGKIPVRILPSFFIMTLLLGMNGTDTANMVAWVAVVLVSVLLHELGHAAMGLSFGLAPQVQLHGMGGTTSWSTGKNLSTWQRIAVSLAGPMAGFGVAGVVRLAAGSHAFAPDSVGEFVYGALIFVNLRWGLLNLLPMLPLDGGNVMAQALNGLTGGRGERPARVVSIGVAGTAAAAAVYYQSWWGALLAASFVLSNWRGLQDLKAREHDAPLQATLLQAHAALDAKDADKVLELARPLALGARTDPVKAEALQLLAFGFLLDGRPADADAAIAAMPRGYSPHASLLELRASVGSAPRAAGAPSPLA